MLSDQVVQAVIATTGPAAIWLSQARSLRIRRWASVIGMASQPFWYLALKDSPHWGINVVAVVSAMGWAMGLWVHWLAPRPTTSGGLATIQLSPDSKRSCS